MHTDVAGAADDFQRRRTAPQLGNARLLCFGNDDMRDVVGTGVVEDAVGNADRRDGHGLCTQPFGDTQRLAGTVALRFTQNARCLDRDGDPMTRAVCPRACGCNEPARRFPAFHRRRPARARPLPTVPEWRGRAYNLSSARRRAGAVRRSANSRNAVRLPGTKKFCTARSAASGK